MIFLVLIVAQVLFVCPACSRFEGLVTLCMCLIVASVALTWTFLISHVVRKQASVVVESTTIVLFHLIVRVTALIIIVVLVMERFFAIDLAISLTVRFSINFFCVLLGRAISISFCWWLFVIFSVLRCTEG